MDLDHWDTATRAEQEASVGRRLADGAPLTGRTEKDDLDLDATQENTELSRLDSAESTRCDGRPALSTSVPVTPVAARSAAVLAGERRGRVSDPGSDPLARAADASVAAAHVRYWWIPA
jgi:hypothetical protein